MGAAHGFHRAAGRVRVVRLASGVQRGPVAQQGVRRAAGVGVEVAEVEQGRGPLPGQLPALGDVEDQSVDVVQVARGGPGAEVGDQGAHQLGHQPPGQGVELPVGDREPGRGQQGGPAQAQPVGGGPGAGEAQGARHAEELLVGLGVVRLGDRPARLEQPYRPLQHAGAGQLEFAGPLVGPGEVAQRGVQAAGHAVLRHGGARRVQQALGGEVVQGGAGGLHGAPGERGGGVRVGQACRGEAQQTQHPGGGRGQRVVHQPGDPVDDGAIAGLRVQLLGEVGDGGLGPGGEPAAGQHQGGWLALALLGEPFGGPRVDGDAHRSGEPGQQFHPGLGVEAAEGAGADVGDAGEGPRGDGDGQAVGVVRKQGVDLFGVGRVVEQEQRPAVGQGGAQRLGEVVLGGSGRGGLRQRVEQSARGTPDGHAGAVGLAQARAQHPVGVAVGDLAYEFLGEGRPARAGPARDEQHARAGGLAAGEGVQSRALDVGAQLLQLPGTAQESTFRGSLPRGPHSVRVHRLIRHGPHSRPTARAGPPGLPDRAFFEA